MKSHSFARYDSLTNIDSPFILHYSLNNWMAHKSDVFELAKHLRHGHLDEVEHPRFNHLDYAWAKNVKEILYNKVINEMARSDADESFLVL